nr:LINE-type retrotransposon LIb DNA [Ipomoea batatas]
MTNMVNQALNNRSVNTDLLQAFMTLIPKKETPETAADNVIFTQEVIHTMNTNKGKKGLMILKVDLHKAYDSVSWTFLETTLVDFGFPRRLINLILFSLRESDHPR